MKESGRHKQLLQKEMMTFTAEWIGILNTTSCENGPVTLILTFDVKEMNYLDLQESPVTLEWHTKLTAVFGNSDFPVGFVFLAHLSKRYKPHTYNKMVKGRSYSCRQESVKTALPGNSDLLSVTISFTLQAFLINALLSESCPCSVFEDQLRYP